MNPYLEASWRHPWRQDLHTGTEMAPGKVLAEPSWCQPWLQDFHISFASWLRGEFQRFLRMCKLLILTCWCYPAGT
ncbi:hypothetical protein [Halorhodospira halochloris]|uniref:hypothetical protein n=1 Tax=Halorhodospira halochloris TaxID=1052 RepID=UPI0013A59FD4|nr:hypothetical protein [Halorhodospira halochloris]